MENKNKTAGQPSRLFTVRNKLLLIFLALSLIPMGILSTVVFRNASDALLNNAFASLEAISTIKQKQLATFFEQLTDDVQFVRDLPAVATELPTLVSLQKSQDDPAYQAAYQTIEGILQPFADDRAIYQDIMLVDLEGNVVYATLNESQDTNVLATNEVKAEFIAASRTTIVIDDITFNVIHNEANLKVGAPIFDSNGTLLGSVVLEVGEETVTEIMTERAGLGETGETYLVGADGLFRTESRFVDQLGVQTAVLNPQITVNTTASQSALAGGTGTEIINDYRGAPVLSSWAPIVIQAPNSYHPNGLTWAFMAEIDEAEVNQPITNLSQFALTFGSVAALVVVVVAVIFTRSFTTQINAITNVFRRVETGDLTTRTPILNRDELGGMATGLNRLLDQLSGLISEIQIERDSIESSIIKLLNEVSDVATGDLTIQAEVTADAAGSIADSFNYMIAQLRSIIVNVQEATLQVGSSANEIQTTAEHLAFGSETQATQIVDTSAAIDEMSVSIQQVSENAALSAQVAQKARYTAREGTNAVQNTIQGMDRIREQGQETAKRIKRLGESSQEIGEIVQLIRDISKRTNLLALNASLEAAAAGEAGRGFAVVAEDVKRLSQRSAAATQQIAGLIKSIQTETNAAVAAMEATTREVVDGSQLANEAGLRLTEIEKVSAELADLIQSISLAARQQARGSETLARSMNTIAEVTQQTAAGTKQAAVSISNLAELADRLRSSVSTFKLPNSNGRNEYAR